MNYNPNFDPTTAPLALKPKSNGPWIVAFLALAGAGAGGYMLHQGRQHARRGCDGGDATRAGRRGREDRAGAARSRSWRARRPSSPRRRKSCRRTSQAKTGELEQLKGTYDKLEDKMKDEIAKGDIRLSQSGGKLRVDLVDKILFDSGEARDLEARRGRARRAWARCWRTIDDKQIQVSGHTDSHADLARSWRRSSPPTGSCRWRARSTSCASSQEKASVPRQAPGRERLRRVPPDRQQQERGRPRAQPPHRDPADAVAGARRRSRSRSCASPRRKRKAKADAKEPKEIEGDRRKPRTPRPTRPASRRSPPRRRKSPRRTPSRRRALRRSTTADPARAPAGQARAPTIQHAAVKRTSAPCTYGSKAAPDGLDDLRATSRRPPPGGCGRRDRAG